MKTRVNISIKPYESYANPLAYVAALVSVAKEGTVARELNQLVSYAVQLAKEAGFKPTEDHGLGDFMVDELGKEAMGIVSTEMLNLAGQLYWDSGKYPLVYTVDDEGDPIEVDMEVLKED